jgi:hypothetical protein
MSWLGLMELAVVLAFGLVWGALELYTLRLDRRAEPPDGRDETSER